jgi:sigma-B regulation protein RsbU (phosphoserine phosphatase)
MDIAPVSVAPRSWRPEPSAVVPGEQAARFDVRAISRPATAFTGDFYFTAGTPEGFWFAAGDFAGHGLRAAIFSAMIQEELEALVRSNRCRPGEVVAALDRMLRREIPGNRFASLVVGRAMPDGAVELVNAGHCAPIVARTNGGMELIESHGPIVGLAPGPRWRPETVDLAPGDRLVLYTDGLVEAEDETGEPFGLDRLVALLRINPPETPLETFLSDARRFSGGRQTDDVTLFVLTRR